MAAASGNADAAAAMTQESESGYRAMGAGPNLGLVLFARGRTVSAHLYRIFPKLGITSRSQLHAAIS